ncbi:MAG: cohesin domain-containing protein [Bacillota bacterium]|nr:cohesin domain-containing protein [Bacillota bacterium]
MSIKKFIAVLLTTLVLLGSMLLNMSLAAATGGLNYSSAQGDILSATPTPDVTSPEVTQPTVSGELYITIDKPTAVVGDIITATINIKGFDSISGYEANIKYDPTVLQPVYSDGTPYDETSAPESGTLLQRRYNGTDFASNDLANGKLTFGRTYLSITAYKDSGTPDNTGSLARISFKVLKPEKAIILLEDDSRLTNAVTGTMLMDWNGEQLSGYKVTQAPIINIYSPETPTNTPTSPVVIDTPTGAPTSTPVNPPEGKVEMKFDKTEVKVGDFVKATISIDNIQNFAGYQFNIKYDKNYLQPWDTLTNAPYGSNSVPDYGTLIQNRYNGMDLVAHDLENGILNFGRVYLNLAAYIASGKPETSGSVAVITFKVVSGMPQGGLKALSFEAGGKSPYDINGIMLFDWDGELIKSDKYVIVQPEPLIAGRGVLGDVDNNGKVDSDDYAYMRQYLIGKINVFPINPINGLIAADVDGDGNFDSDDYAYMRQLLIGKISKFPAEL